MKFFAATLALTLSLFASADAMELTKSSFAAEVKDSGKNAFVKFLAPWCVAALRFRRPIAKKTQPYSLTLCANDIFEH